MQSTVVKGHQQDIRKSNQKYQLFQCYQYLKRKLPQAFAAYILQQIQKFCLKLNLSCLSLKVMSAIFAKEDV